MIKHIRHSEIDRRKWNFCVENAENTLPYALSWYLDIVSPNWEALVYGDYLAVMPLPVKKKFAFKYLIQPYLCQQLGVFSSISIDNELINRFIKAIPHHFYALQLNYNNQCKGRQLPNLVLSLSDSYDAIRKNFTENTRRNIEKTQKNEISVKEISIPDFFDFFYSVEKKYSVPNEILNLLITKCLEMNKISLLGAFNADNELLAVLALLNHQYRLICFLFESSQRGKEFSAMFAIINDVVKNYSNTPYILDFEGSKIEGVARFYRGFGSEDQPYFFIEKNRPEWLFNR